MSDDQRPRSALQLAEQGVHRPRRAPNPPRIAESDRLDPAELARARRESNPPWRRIVRSR